MPPQKKFRRALISEHLRAEAADGYRRLGEAERAERIPHAPPHRYPTSKP